MVGFVIGTIAIVLSLLVLGYFTRKKYYKEIDRLENWKIDILDRPVLEEMSKVKQLNMTGQTEELFDQWRKEWDEIVGGQLPDIEELLFDSEEYIDKLRFKKARGVQLQIESILTDTEEKIRKILSELSELIGSEQKNREEIEELKYAYRDCKKALLAHRHTFSHAVESFEVQLEDCATKFQEFEEKTENGDYLEAREVVLSIKDTLMRISDKMQVIPRLLIDCQTGLPMQINELKDGYQEMVEQGYCLLHLQFEKETIRLEAEIQTFLTHLELTEIEEVETGIEAVKEAIELLYVLLEKEVLAKHYIQQHKDETKSLITGIVHNSETLNEETELVQQIYHLSEIELEAHRQSEKQLAQLIKDFEQLEIRLTQPEFAQTHLSEDLNEIQSMIQKLEQEQKDYREILQALRKDELASREKVQDLKKNVSDTIRNVTKSKIPGLPKEYEFLLDDAKESIQTVMEKLSEKPLDIPTVQHFLDIAVISVEELVSTTKEMLENVVLAEKVIQYGNRYKSKYSSVAQGLYEAELAFRDYDYKSALEQAATTIEKVEPGAIKRIEAMLSEEIL